MNAVSIIIAASTFMQPVVNENLDSTLFLTDQEIEAIQIVQDDLLSSGISTHILLNQQFEASSCRVFEEIPEMLPNIPGVAMHAIRAGIDDDFDGIPERYLTDEVCVANSGVLIRATIKANSSFEF